MTTQTEHGESDERVAFRFKNFRNYRLRSLLYATKPDWSLLPIFTTVDLRSTGSLRGPPSISRVSSHVMADTTSPSSLTRDAKVRKSVTWW